MRKVGTEASNRSLLVTTRLPGHHRPVLAKQLKCQIAALRDPGQRAKYPASARWRSQFRGAAKTRGWRFGRGSDGPIWACTAPDYAAVGGRLIAPTKPAPIAQKHLSGNQARSATLAIAQALATQRVPSTVQNQKCLDFIQETILF
jgi:hypothetical protein